MEIDVLYYARRADEERAAARRALSAKARDCHTELAAAYEYRVRVLAAEERRSAIHLTRAM